MEINEIKHEHHYAIRLGRWTVTGRVDAIDPPKVIVWIEVLGYRPVPHTAVLYACKSPSYYDEQHRKRKHESFLRRQEWEKRYSKPAPCPLFPQHHEPIINRQGSRFRSGDYGITRE